MAQQLPTDSDMKLWWWNKEVDDAVTAKCQDAETKL